MKKISSGFFFFLLNSVMVTRIILISGAIAISIILISGCGNKNKEVVSSLLPKANVFVTTVKKEGISDTIFLSATNVYNKKTAVQAPISGYVTKVNVSTGNLVAKGYEVFNMVTKEYRSLNTSKERIDSNS